MYNNFQYFIESLKSSVLAGLPGQSAQLKMAPPFRNPKGFDISAQHEARIGAVLILLYPYNNSVRVVLTERADYAGHHSSQVSFPGGKMEQSDEDLYSAALREANEEIGINKESVNYVAELTSLYIPVSNFRVHPFLSFTHEKPTFIPNEREVKSIVELDLNSLNDKNTIGYKKIKLANGLTLETPFYNIESKTVWGATAMILSELQELLNR